MDGKIPLRIELDGRSVHSETVYVQAGAYALTVMTTLPRPDVPIELHSTYVGHPGVSTLATHLHLGPEAGASSIETAEHADHDVCLVFSPRNAVYDHASVLIEFLVELGYRASLDIRDGAFDRLEAVG